MFLTGTTSPNLYAQTVNDSLSFYNSRITQPKDKNDLASAYRFYTAYKKFSIKEEKPLGTVYALRQLAEIQKQLGYLDESELLNTEILEILNDLETSEIAIQYKGGAYNHLGMIYRSRKNYDQALQFYELAKGITDNPERLTYIHNNAGFVYLKKKNYEKAAIQFQLAHDKSLLTTDSIQIARSLDNLGFTESILRNPDAVSKLQKALSLRKKIKYSSGIQTSLEHLSEHYALKNDTTKALNYAQEALLLAESTEDLKKIESALALNIKLGRNRLAPRYIQIKDSLSGLKDVQRSNFNYYVSLYSEKEKELQKSELLSTQRKNINLIIALVGILLLIIAVFLYFIQRSRHRKKILQQVYDTESRISKKVHDEIANDVFQFMTKLQSNIPTDTILIDELETIYHKTRNISKEYDILDSTKTFKVELEGLFMNYQTSATNVVVRNLSNIEWDKYSEIEKETIYKVLQELLINMKKHSLASLVLISFEKTRSNILIQYSDNGAGCDLKKSTGLTNVTTRIESLSGKIEFETQKEEGFKARITI